MSALRLPKPGGVLGGSRRPRASSFLGAAGLAGGLAVLAGALVGSGRLGVGLGVVGAVVVIAWAAGRVEHVLLGVLATLPFMPYPAAVGGFSVFLGLPLAGVVIVFLLIRQPGTLGRLRGRLSIATFAVLLTTATVSAALSSDQTTAGSRVLYLLTFALFAVALSEALALGLVSSRTLGRALVAGAFIAGVALIVQVLLGLAAGKDGTISWLNGVYATFGGERAANYQTRNWYISQLSLVRGIFPFMAAPSAGQYMMLGLIGAVWLRRQPSERAEPRWIAVVESLAALVLAAALLLTFSRQAWLGAVAGLIALSARRRPISLLVVLASSFLVLSVVPVPGAHQSFGEYLLTASDTTTTSSGTRIGLWSQALNLIPSHAVVGVGPGLYGTLVATAANPIDYAHNVFLDAAVELGLVGAVALVLLCLGTIRSAWSRGAVVSVGMLVAWMTANLFDDVFYFPRNGFLLAAAFALATATRASDRRARDASAPLPTGPRS